MQRGQRLGFELLGACHTGTADPIMLDVLPYPLARVQLRRIPGQEAPPQLPIGRLGECLDGLGAVDRMAIQDQQHRARAVIQQPTAEIDEHRAIQAAL